MVASLIFDAVLSLAPDQRQKPVAILCTDTRVEIPAVLAQLVNRPNSGKRTKSSTQAKGTRN
jgi:hypothetical protein